MADSSVRFSVVTLAFQSLVVLNCIKIAGGKNYCNNAPTRQCTVTNPCRLKDQYYPELSSPRELGVDHEVL